jgi:intracellular sulfur oxidation DsrE/DsrF family protein
MKSFTRRSFVETAGFGLAAMGMIPATSEAQLTYRKQDWKFAEFEKLVKDPAKAKQVYDIRPIDGGKFLNNIKNSLNGFQFGFGLSKEQIKVVAALHGPSNVLNFDDAAWAKYKIGEWFQVNDPATGAPAVRNIFFPQKESKSADPQDAGSSLQDTSIQALQARGVTFLSCHTATEEQVRGLIKLRGMKEPVEEIVQDLQSHILPGVVIVPAMVATISLLQSEGRFTYITV